jgi:ferrous iron transport protein B
MKSRVYFVGNPNAGKTLLFNLLTGRNAKVANFPGVTVESKTGALKENPDVEVIDLPGVYSLCARSEDERITAQMIAQCVNERGDNDHLVAIVDATQLKKGLFLVAELQERARLDAVVLTMGDLVGASLTPRDIHTLASRIGVPVFLVSAATQIGLIKFKDFLREPRKQISPAPFHLSIENRHRLIDTWLTGINVTVSKSKLSSKKIDKIALHPIFGPLVLIGVFGLLFEGLFLGSKPFVTLIEFLKTSSSAYVHSLFADDSLVGSLLADGIIGGVGSVLAFVPLIAFLFLFLGALEDSGYMARAVFLLHRLMSKVGLSGKAFVPLVSGFSCSIPAILSTRIIESRSERFASILVTPLISCSARLPIYGLLIGAAFSHVAPLWGFVEVGALVMVFMYVFGVVLAFLVAGLLRKTLLKGKSTPLIMELPDYRWPRPRNLWFSVKTRVRVFIKDAGTVILALTIVLWALFTFPLGASGLEHSYAGQIGQFIEPLISPLGFDWRIGVSLIASFAAREVFISTFGLIYGLEQIGGDTSSLWNSVTPVYTPLVALSLLVFLAVSLQCISTLAVTRKETSSWRWPLFQLGYLNSLAWLLSFAVFQGGRALGF